MGCVTATSRCTWAFARDGGIPGSKWWRAVNKTFDIPLNALGLAMMVEICLGAIYFGSSAAYNAFSGVGVIFLTMSYACPVAVSLIFRRREDIEKGSFSFGIVGAIANVIALGEFLALSLTLYLLNVSRLEPSRHSSLLYANPQGCDLGQYELRLRCVCWICRHRSCLVWSVGISQLPRPAHRRRPARRRFSSRVIQRNFRLPWQNQEPQSVVHMRHHRCLVPSSGPQCSHSPFITRLQRLISSPLHRKPCSCDLLQTKTCWHILSHPWSFTTSAKPWFGISSPKCFSPGAEDLDLGIIKARIVVLCTDESREPSGINAFA